MSLKPLQPWYKDAKQVIHTTQADPAKGLTSKQVKDRQAEYGRNEMPEQETTSYFELILKQFTEDQLVIILLISAAISLVLGIWEQYDGNDEISYVEALIEPSVIMIILICNAIVGVWQESSAEDAIKRLKEYEAATAIVWRDGKKVQVDPTDLVVGDVVDVKRGHKVPADIRLIRLQSSSMRVDQSMLTGESDAVHKQVEKIPQRSGDVVQSYVNMVFSGTLATYGDATGVVCFTGAETQMGIIAMNLMEESEEATPLKQKLDDFADQLSWIILGICVVVWLINIPHFGTKGNWMSGAVYYFKIAVSLAVAAIPEGLPAVVTTCLALGTQTMAKNNAIIRSLPSCETLGCTTVICSDKTGTLTTNQMCVQRVATMGGNSITDYSIEGNNFCPVGGVKCNATEVRYPSLEDPALEMICRISSLCNESSLQCKPKKEELKKGSQSWVDDIDWGMSGEPTEAAFRVLAEKLLPPISRRNELDAILNSNDPDRRVRSSATYYGENYSKIHTLEFNRKRKSMSVVCTSQRGDNRLYCKGAAENVLTRCDKYMSSDSGKCQITNINNHVRDAIHEKMDEYCNQGLRCLAVAEKEFEGRNADPRDPDQHVKIEQGMTFIGLVAMKDPPRKEVAKAIKECQAAGIRVMMITGDNQKTAEAIAKEIGLLKPDASQAELGIKSFTGGQFMKLEVKGARAPKEQKAKMLDALGNAVLFSRVEPAHKLEIVKLLRNSEYGLGEVVAMTGDGVNDAPALKEADIGIGMGTGTAVAREASDMILQDDNFATIVMAVREGRAIYQNTKQFIRYLISSNIGEVACIFLTAALGMPEGLIPVQLLWVNLVTDGLPATALGFNRPDADIMRRAPRGRKDPIIDGWMFFRYMLIGLYIGFGTVLGFAWWYMMYDGGPQLDWEHLTNFLACGHNAEIYPTEFTTWIHGPGFLAKHPQIKTGCEIFYHGKGGILNTASTISLSILVTIEMFNTFNALSENQSLLVVPPWDNIFVVLAVSLSMGLHVMILEVPFFIDIFSTASLNQEEWLVVIGISAPVILLDEMLKMITRWAKYDEDWPLIHEESPLCLLDPLSWQRSRLKEKRLKKYRV